MRPPASSHMSRKLALLLLPLALAGVGSVPGASGSPADEPRDAPFHLRINGATGSTVSLSWKATREEWIRGYGVYRDGELVATVATRSASVSGLECGTTYTFGVDAVDTFGQRSAMTTINGSTSACPPPEPGDVTPPTVPRGLSAGASTGTSVTVSWSPSNDDVGVAGYGLYLAGWRVATTTSTEHTFSGLVCGTSYTTGVDAYDAAGNRSATAVLVVATASCPATRDTLAPTAPANLTKTSVGETAISLKWEASTDNVGVTAYAVSVNGTVVGTTSATTYDAGALECGTGYTVGVTAHDAAGNVSPKAVLVAATRPCPAIPIVPCDRVAAPDGSDAAPGTLAAPFLTVQKLADSLVAGQTGCVRGGRYTSSDVYVLDVSEGGFRIRSYPGERARLYGTTVVRPTAPGVALSHLDLEGDGLAHPLKIYAADTIVEDSDITTAGRPSSCVMLGSSSYGPATRTIIRRNRFHDCGSVANGTLDHAIYAARLRDGRITNNVFWNSSGYTLQLYPDAQRTLFAFNIVDGGGPSVRGGVIFGGEDSLASKDNTVEHNVIAYAATYNITSNWDSVVGVGNLARLNCLWQGREGDIGGFVGFTALGNITADPGFRDRANHDYRLSPLSPCLLLLGQDPAAGLG